MAFPIFNISRVIRQCLKQEDSQNSEVKSILLVLELTSLHGKLKKVMMMLLKQLEEIEREY